MSEALERLLRYRILIVTGKGGTGKTSVSAALAELASARGIDVLVIEVTREGPLQALLGRGPGIGPDDGRTPVRLREHLFALRIDPRTALEEYLELQLHLRGVVRPVVRNTTFGRLLDAAPGWRELITLGKIWHLEQQRLQGAPRHGLLIVDAPATGHGLSLLSVPKVVVEMVRMGPLRRQTEQVQALMLDHGRTRVVLVTLAEELPVLETLELSARAGELGMAVGPVLANAMEPEFGSDAAARELLAALPDATPVPPLVAPRTLEQILDFTHRRASLQRNFLDQLRRALAAPVVALPRLLRPIDDASGARGLAEALERSLSGVIA
jgi:anion-transporting  ArsA/GET3 family ATPase